MSEVFLYGFGCVCWGLRVKGSASLAMKRRLLYTGGHTAPPHGERPFRFLWGYNPV